MIRIEHASNGFKVEGHSTYGTHGNDIVCASVSSITQTALLGLVTHTFTSYTQEDGYLDVFIHSYNGAGEIILNTMVLGLREVRRLYPDQVEIKEVEPYENER